MKTRGYVCRDCSHVFNPDKPTNKCPQCGSIYLLPQNFRATRQPKVVSVKLSERFLSLILGFVFGLLTFFIWGIAALLKGGPGSAKVAAGAFYFGLKFSLVMAVCVGITGFVWGDEKLVRLLGVLWGTDQEFNDEVDSRMRSIPMWVVYLFLVLAIVGSYGYLAVRH
jgi:DNA-directed RNA polymerase subunit RPC12/RpoP